MSTIVPKTRPIVSTADIEDIYSRCPLRICYTLEVKRGYRMDRMAERMVYDGYQPSEDEIFEYINTNYPKNNKVFFKILEIERLRFTRYGRKIHIDEITKLYNKINEEEDNKTEFTPVGELPKINPADNLRTK